MPSEVFVSITPALREFLKEDKDTRRDYALVDEISLDKVYALVDERQKRAQKEKKKQPPMVHELMEGSEVVHRKQLQSDQELTPVERLRLESEERKYQRSVQDVGPLKFKPTGTTEDHTGQHLKLATGMAGQFIVAFVGAFALGFYFVENFVTDDFTTKALSGAGVSFLTLLVEVLLFIIREEKQSSKFAYEKKTARKLKTIGEMKEEEKPPQKQKSKMEKKKD
eukprot:gnl/MRDRNA2_/MRDRNA2_122058_c0_seq1.p1 gnl/MRDRNA2_/MRDRNA2_122058_c0~~gnl/MRDRNA2_/MRDRNA2_122058_c0_seq1.p1  ORF type:complete len:224 (+),score=54.08 gnl/MRDRNA2_/MRDRNA2_122058_c0_seq1:71-742(+)